MITGLTLQYLFSLSRHRCNSSDRIRCLKSRSEKILAGPTYYGQMIEFCRQKGHGFVRPADGGEPLFVHISEWGVDIILLTFRD